MLQKIAAIDKHIARFISSRRNPYLSGLLRAASVLGSAYFAIPVYVLAFALGGLFLRQTVLAVVTAELILFPFMLFLRYATRRKRPSTHPVCCWEPWNRYSFPSYHAARIWLLAFVLCARSPVPLLVMIIVGLLISFSRLYLEKHYLSDVLAGALCGVLAGFVGNAICM